MHLDPMQLNSMDISSLYRNIPLQCDLESSNCAVPDLAGSAVESNDASM